MDGWVEGPVAVQAGRNAALFSCGACKVRVRGKPGKGGRCWTCAGWAVNTGAWNGCYLVKDTCGYVTVTLTPHALMQSFLTFWKVSVL